MLFPYMIAHEIQCYNLSENAILQLNATTAYSNL